MKRIILALALAASAFGQDGISVFPPAPGGFVYTGPLSDIPATCTVGQLAFITDATAGKNQYNCTAANTWTQNASGGGGLIASRRLRLA